MTLFGTRSSYTGSGSPVIVNDAAIRMELKPEGTTGPTTMFSAMIVGVGYANLDGPFRWKIVATGERGLHEAMYVRAIRTRTSISKHDEFFPRSYLGSRIDFKKKRSYKADEVRADFEVPGKLTVKPSEDGVLDVMVDLEIVKKSRKVRKVVKFRLDPTKRKENQTIFIPAEIISSIGKPMSEWDEKGWDR